MDYLYRTIKKVNYTHNKNVVLFSTHHVLGFLNVPSAIGSFVPDKKGGFIEHFKYLHGYFAKLALMNPHKNFIIKTKFVNIWHNEVKQSIKEITKKNFDDIPNLFLTSETSAHELIKKACLVVGLNSTTLIEAKLAKIPVVLPIFKEAKHKYFKTHIYFQKYLRYFSVANSPEEFLRLTNDILSNSSFKHRMLPKQMIKDYIGFFDGKVAGRIVKTMRREIISLNK